MSLVATGGGLVFGGDVNGRFPGLRPRDGRGAVGDQPRVRGDGLPDHLRGRRAAVRRGERGLGGNVVALHGADAGAAAGRARGTIWSCLRCLNASLGPGRSASVQTYRFPSGIREIYPLPGPDRSGVIHPNPSLDCGCTVGVVFRSREAGAMERLTAKRAETLRKPGRYQAGDTVYLVVAKGRTGRVNKRWVQRLHVQGKRRRHQHRHVPGRHAVRGSGAGARQPPDGEAGRRPVRACVDRADVRGLVRQGRPGGPVARPYPRDAAADPGAVCGASHGATRRPDRPGGGALGARAGLPRQAGDREALARLGSGRARGGASSRARRRERGGRSDRRGIAEDPEDPSASAGVAVRGRSRGAGGGRGVRVRSGRQGGDSLHGVDGGTGPARLAGRRGARSTSRRGSGAYRRRG